MIDHTRPILIVLLIATSLGIAACGGTSFKTEERQTFKDASRTATVEAQVPEGIEEITLDLGLEVRKGTVAFTVRDPRGTVVWSGELTAGGEISDRRDFPAVAGPWRLELSMDQASGEYRAGWQGG